MSIVEKIIYDPNHLKPFSYGRNVQQDGSIEAEISTGDNQNSCESPSAEKNEVADSDFKAVRIFILQSDFFSEFNNCLFFKVAIEFLHLCGKLGSQYSRIQGRSCRQMSPLMRASPKSILLQALILLRKEKV